MTDYLDLRAGAPRRLRALKRAAEKLNSCHNARKAAGDNRPYTWRDVRYSGFHNAAASRCQLSRGLNNGRPIWYAHTGEQFLREKYADEVITWLNHRGWFTDPDYGSTCRGLVVSLPHGRYLAGYHVSDSDERVYFPDIYKCEIEAARVADNYAQEFAEDEREYQERWRAARDLDDDIEELRARLAELLALRNLPRFPNARQEARRVIESIRDKQETLKNDYSDIGL